jgi:hypothetical protein
MPVRAIRRMQHRRNRLSAFRPAARSRGRRRGWPPKALDVLRPLVTPEDTPHALARCLLNLVGADADSDLLPMDETFGPANNVGTARIIVRTDGYVVGMGGNEGSSRGNEGSSRGNARCGCCSAAAG